MAGWVGVGGGTAGGELRSGSREGMGILGMDPFPVRRDGGQTRVLLLLLLLLLPHENHPVGNTVINDWFPEFSHIRV